MTRTRHPISTQPLVDALAEFDRTEAERAARWAAIETNAEVHAAIDADQAALRKVREAFYQVTCDRNTRENCMRVDITYARQIAALGELEPFRPAQS